MLAGTADHPGVTVDADIAEAAPVRANEGLRSAVDNLVENAIEHAGPEVTVRDGDERVTLTVADDGPGIPPERRDSLLDEGGVTGLDRGDDGSDEAIPGTARSAASKSSRRSSTATAATSRSVSPTSAGRGSKSHSRGRSRDRDRERPRRASASRSGEPTASGGGRRLRHVKIPAAPPR
ncbi:hypothetical protein FK85_29785 [Halorubrum saccharovorum]|uniref:histidine kinase n=1 Tax=Halorubrum saccharovorum TaxID=2248 RepID=A0A0F8CK54_9EURY|nr:HAMP domain-containing sensor histidine kinase [Halorubrum saccharovorum]KKF39282.1 hypothetical protein FK85_29785 [Halorubrum saccharovorum]